MHHPRGSGAQSALESLRAPGVALAVGAALVAGLSACGGGGGSDSGATPQNLKTADAHCSSLTAGPHRGIALSASSTDPNAREYTLTLVSNVDLSGPTPVVAGPNGRTTLTPVAGEACHYRGDDLDLLVSPSGAIAFTRVNASLGTGALQLYLAFPEQTSLVASDFAGDWVGLTSNAQVEVAGTGGSATVGSDGSTSTTLGTSTITAIHYSATAVNLRIDSQGTVAIADCLGNTLGSKLTAKATCKDAGSTLGQLTRHTDGAWSLNVSDPESPSAPAHNWRVFSYQTSKGKMAMAIDARGKVMFLSPLSALPLPPLGYATHTADAIMLGELGSVVSTINDSRYTVTSTPGSMGSSYTRSGVITNSVTLATTNENQTLTLNQPMTGLAWRTVASGMVYALPLKGMGMTFAALPLADGRTRFALSVDRSN